MCLALLSTRMRPLLNFLALWTCLQGQSRFTHWIWPLKCQWMSTRNSLSRLIASNRSILDITTSRSSKLTSLEFKTWHDLKSGKLSTQTTLNSHNWNRRLVKFLQSWAHVVWQIKIVQIVDSMAPWAASQWRVPNLRVKWWISPTQELK